VQVGCDIDREIVEQPGPVVRAERRVMKQIADGRSSFEPSPMVPPTGKMWPSLQNGLWLREIVLA
jgi:hypothetical protein